MRHFFAALALLIVATVFAAPPSLPDFVETCFKDANLDYTPPHGEMEPVLEKYFSRQSATEPWSLIADFNGDDVDDWAGLVRAADRNLALIAVVSTAGGCTHHLLTPLGPDESEITVGITLEPPGTVTGIPFNDGDSSPSVTLVDPGIHLVYLDKASVLYYLRDNSFHEFWTSD